jgi:hypothetical protein
MNASCLAFLALASSGPRPEYLSAVDGIMNTMEVPACPRCENGGKVKLVSIDASSVFQPLPDGWDKIVYEFQCECGWSIPADRQPAEPVRRRARPK